MVGILFKNDDRLFGCEKRVKCNKHHLHIIILHYNICLGFGFKGSKYDNPIEAMFYNDLCKR
ncbi:MAG: hypothetical protein MUO21_07865 [Nitrososphaeraceae archaeon]|nr:hypothetical protein [Nitrososphaeraceae archaeon]